MGVRATIIGEDEIQKEAADRGVPSEVMWKQASEGANRKILKPPFYLFALSLFREKNSELGQCIEAMCTNISGYGYRLLPVTLGCEPEDEYADLAEFLNYGDWDGQSHTAVKKLIRGDLEGTGNAALELIISAGGQLIGYNQVPVYQCRIAVQDSAFTIYTDRRIVGRGDRRRVVIRQRLRKFRRYVQLASEGSTHKLTWFKELGDPRPISRDTGAPLTEAELAAGHLQANVMVWFRLPVSRTPYGLPRWIGNLYSVLGGYAAEEINYKTIKSNNIPSMLLMVSNGQLTPGTVSRIKEFTKVIREGDNYSRFLIIEADPDNSELGGGQVKIEVEPLAQLQKDDAMFQGYEKGNQSKIRRSFRLPAALVGQPTEGTAEVLEAERRIADEQVFAPERTEEDWMWNKILCFGGAFGWKYVSNGPNVTDDSDLIRVMSAAERSGAMTPRRASAMLEDIMGTSLSPLSDKVDLDVPFSQQMAEAVKNKANPAEVGQQVTALKSAIVDHSS